MVDVVQELGHLTELAKDLLYGVKSGSQEVEH